MLRGLQGNHMKTLLRGITLSFISLNIAHGYYDYYTYDNLTGQDFSNSNLMFDSFRNATLQNVNFTNSIISGADFSSTTDSGFTASQLYTTASYQSKNLHRINFSENNLSDWDLSGQQLERTVFRDSLLSNTDFSSAVFFGSQLTRANVTGAIFTDAAINSASFGAVIGLSSNQLYSTASYKEGNLSSIGFTQLDLSGWDFSNQRLSMSSFRNSVLSNANFEGAILLGTSFDSANLTAVDLSGKDLKGASFYGTELKDSDFSGTTIQGADFGHAENFTSNQLYSTKSYQTRDLSKTDLGDLNLQYWNFSEQDLTSAIFYNSDLNSATFSNAAAHRTDFSNTQLQNANFNQADLTESSFAFSTLSNTTFTGADLSEADFLNTKIISADFTDALINRASFTAAQGFSSNHLYATQNYKYKDLEGIGLGSQKLNGWDFSEQNLNNSHFHSSDLTGATFSNASLQNVSFSYADLSSASLSNTDLSRANLAYAKLHNTSFTGADITETDFGYSEGLESNQFYRTKNYQAGNLAKVRLSGMNLQGWDFENQNLQEAEFYKTDLSHTSFKDANLENAELFSAKLENADFTDAVIRGAAVPSSLTKEQLYSTDSYKKHDLRATRFDSIDMTGWNLDKQDLRDSLFGYCNLSEATLNDALIRNIKLGNWVPLTTEQLTSTASYKNGDLSRMSIENGNLDGINLSGKVLKNINLGNYYFGFGTLVSMNNADLSYANFSGATIRGGSFNNSNLEGINLSKSYVAFTTFSNANLRAANLSFSNGINARDSNLRNASLYGAHANLFGSDISGADIRFINIGQYNYNNSSELFGFGPAMTSNQLYSTASYKNNDLRGIRLINQLLHRWDFSNQNLIDSSFGQSNLNGSDFSGSDLRGASFGLADRYGSFGCNLTNVNFSGSDIRNATFTFAGSTMGRDAGFTREQLYSTASYGLGDISGLKLYSSNLDDWCFKDQNLSNATLDYSSLNGTDFAEAEINGISFEGVTGFTSSQLYSTASYKKKELGAINWRAQNLADWDLSFQDLRGSSFYNTYLKNTDFSDTLIQNTDFLAAENFTRDQLTSTSSFKQKDLSGVRFGIWNLSGMNLAGFNLSNAEMQSANFANTDFSMAEIRGAVLPRMSSNQLYQTASYRDKDLSSVDFTFSDMYDWNFSEQNLSFANLAHTRLNNADLSGADLHMAKLPHELPSIDILSGSTVIFSNNMGTAVDGHIDNHSGGTLQIHSVWSPTQTKYYYQEAGASLLFHAGKDYFSYSLFPPLIFEPLMVENTAEFEAGAIIGCRVHARELAGFKNYNFKLLEAGTLIVSGVTNATDLSSLEINNTLIHADFYAEDNSIYANLSRMKLSEVMGLAPESQLAKISDYIDDNDYAVLDLLETVQPGHQKRMLNRLFNQKAPVQHLQNRGNKQATGLISTRSHTVRARKDNQDSPTGASGPHQSGQELEGWTKTYGSWISQDSTTEYSGYDANLWGQIIGLDKAFGRALLGIAGGFNRSNLSADNSDSADSDSWFGALYSSLGTKDWYLETSLSYADSAVETRSGGSANQTADFNTHLLGLFVETGKEFELSKKLKITPSIGGSLTHYRQPSYTETSPSAPDRQFEEYNKTSFISSLGATISRLFEHKTFKWGPEVNLNWDHNFHADADRITFGFEGSPDRYSFKIQAPEEDALRAGLGITLYPSESWEIATGIEVLWAEEYSALTADASLRLRF